MANLLQQIKNSLDANRSSPAFCIEDRFYSYNELNNEICKTISLLNRNKTDTEIGANIGIITNNDFQTYASLIACWFLGFAYVPINPAIPKERNKIIIQEAGIKWILNSSDKGPGGLENDFGIRVIITSEKTDYPLTELIVFDENEDRNAYIIFTSGSTGIPKGVPVTQRNLSAFVENFNSTDFAIDSTDRCLQMFELTFDVSVSSFLLPLLRGACVYPAAGEGIRYMQVLKLIQQYQLTNVQIVPSIIRLAGPLLKRFKFPWVKNCIVTGEATSIDLIPEWFSCLPNARVFNFYGPTEATIYCSFYECGNPEFKNYHGMLSIGKPMGSMELLVLDEHQKELQSGEKGELYIGGAQLTAGYLNNPTLTRNAFIELEQRKGSVFYKSGDMAYIDGEGDIYYCGRLDNQVKIQGFRIELGEIEFLVRNQFKLNNVVIVIENKNASELTLIVETQQTPPTETILGYLKSKLPSYMLPSRVTDLPEFPLTSSGKTDRRKIRAIFSVGVE